MGLPLMAGDVSLLEGCSCALREGVLPMRVGDPHRFFCLRKRAANFEPEDNRNRQGIQCPADFQSAS